MPEQLALAISRGLMALFSSFVQPSAVHGVAPCNTVRGVDPCNIQLAFLDQIAMQLQQS